MSEAHEKTTRIRQIEDAAAHWEHKYVRAREYNRNLEERCQRLEADLAHKEAYYAQFDLMPKSTAETPHEAPAGLFLGDSFVDRQGRIWKLTEYRTKDSAKETEVEQTRFRPMDDGLCIYCGRDVRAHDFAGQACRPGSAMQDRLK